MDVNWVDAHPLTLKGTRGNNLSRYRYGFPSRGLSSRDFLRQYFRCNHHRTLCSVTSWKYRGLRVFILCRACINRIRVYGQWGSSLGGNFDHRFLSSLFLTRISLSRLRSSTLPNFLRVLLRLFSQPCSLPGSPCWINFEPSLKKFARPSEMGSFRALLGLEHGLYLLDASIVYVKGRNWIRYNVSCTKPEVSIGVQYFLWKVESPLFLQPRWNTMPHPFVQIATEVKSYVQISHVKLIILELASKWARKIWLNGANVPLMENQISRVNVNLPPENSRWKGGESISTGSIKKLFPIRGS